MTTTSPLLHRHPQGHCLEMDGMKRLTETLLQKHLSFFILGSELVGLGRVELPTSPLSGVRSSQLSYRPNFAYGL